MNEDHIRGLARKTKGYIEQLAGKMTGDKKLLQKGKQDRLEGWQQLAQADLQDVHLSDPDNLERDDPAQMSGR